MAEKGQETIVSMGAEEPLAALSKAHPPLYDYFKQCFSHVTNTSIDALREACKTDCSIYIGDDGNLLSRDSDNCTVLELPSPVLTAEEFQRIEGMILATKYAWEHHEPYFGICLGHTHRRD